MCRLKEKTMLNLEANEVIERLGGVAATARICGIKPPSVSEWKKRNHIPKSWLMYFECAYSDQLNQEKGNDEVHT